MARKKITFPKVSKIEQYAKRNAFVLKGGISTAKTGRPSVMTQEVVRKLEHSFVYDCTVEEACLYAGISRTAYYEFCKKYPQFTDRIEQLRHATFFVLRKCIVAAAEHDADLALKYLERKLPIEFSTRAQMHHTGEVSDRHSVDPEQIELIRKAMGNFAKKVSKA
jgi:hypothetical protein